MQFCFNNAALFLLYVLYSLFFIGFVTQMDMHFFENTLYITHTHIQHRTTRPSVIVRGWRTCVIGRNSFRAIYMSRGNCVSGAHLRHEALCLDGKVYHRFSPRWVELSSYEVDRILEGDSPRQSPEYWAQMHADQSRLLTILIIPKVLKSVQRKSAMFQ